jgi:hypothetical protein
MYTNSIIHRSKYVDTKCGQAMAVPFPSAYNKLCNKQNLHTHTLPTFQHVSDALLDQMICSKFQIRTGMSFPNTLTGFQSTENKNAQCLSILHQTNFI